ncbi:hypothetical protein BDV59DRAFT_186199 [Aspergillus ambiguus]|uniref:uncharacterized protein n=1 Tax=Aspergillus ambiguus TaxID=176160 RepID=UPI003CCDF4D3
MVLCGGREAPLPIPSRGGRGSMYIKPSFPTALGYPVSLVLFPFFSSFFIVYHNIKYKKSKSIGGRCY